MVIETVYDTLAERYVSISLGQSKSSMITTISEVQSTVDKVESTVGRFPKLLQTAIGKATGLITGQSGGYVVINTDSESGQPYELLILDAPSIDEAVNVWRWNVGGLGFSRNGYNGPYETAITADGQIVADFITSGSLVAKVTATLGGDVKPADPVKPTPVGIKAGDLVTIAGSTYYNGKAIPGWVKKLRWYVVEVSGDRAVINKDESGRYAIMSPVKTSAIAVAGTKPSEDYRNHTVVHGDTLWAIAKKYLGNGSRYKEIVSLNGLKSNVIYSGMKLKIPNK